MKIPNAKQLWSKLWPVEKARPVDKLSPYVVGLEDARLGGWFNDATGELYEGYAVEAHDIVLDVGCGDGGNASFCANRGAHIILADIDAANVERAVQRLSTSPARRVDGHVTDANPLPLADNSVSRIICTEVLEHVDDLLRVTAELVRVGQPGALYLITVPDPAAEHLQKRLAAPAYFEHPNHIRIIEREDFGRLIEDSGLIIERRSSHGFFWAMWWLLFWQAENPVGDGVNPSIDAWTETWNAVLKARGGLKVKETLDAFMPKSQVIVARKPG